MLYNLYMDYSESSDPNPWGFLKSLQEGQDWLDRLELEAFLIGSDLLTLDKQLTEASKAALSYSIVKTEEAIERIMIEMKMFNE